MRIYLKEGFAVNLYPLIISNFMQNIKKSNVPILSNRQGSLFFS